MKKRREQLAPLKQSISIRLDADVVEYFRTSGPGWQTRINEVLRRAVTKEKNYDRQRI